MTTNIVRARSRFGDCGPVFCIENAQTDGAGALLHEAFHVWLDPPQKLVVLAYNARTRTHGRIILTMLILGLPAVLAQV